MHSTQQVPGTCFGVRNPDAAEHVDQLAETPLVRIEPSPVPLYASRSPLPCNAIAGTARVPLATRMVERYEVRGSSLAPE